MTVDPETLAKAGSILRGAGRVVVFTGAGVSAESGIPTFRDDDGFWQRFPLDEFARWDGLMRMTLQRPRVLAEFLTALLEPIALARPNPAHLAIAQLEQHRPTTVITQNVDGLHQDAGSTRVREIHGSFFRVVSLRGRPRYSVQRQVYLSIVARLKRAQTGWFPRTRLALALQPVLGLSLFGLKRPGIVLFGAAMAEPAWSEARADLQGCDVLLVIGTSGAVYPAATLSQLAREHGARIISVDPVEPGNNHVWLRGRAGEVLPPLMQNAFGPEK